MASPVEAGCVNAGSQDVLVAAAQLDAAGPSERDTEEAALKALLAPLD
jgi:hypothetical protein